MLNLKKGSLFLFTILLKMFAKYVKTWKRTYNCISSNQMIILHIYSIHTNTVFKKSYILGMKRWKKKLTNMSTVVIYDCWGGGALDGFSHFSSF